jgi:hypothetical protein
VKISTNWDVVGHAFPHKVEVDLDIDMLCALVLNGVGGEVDGVDVITVDEGALP